MNLSTSLPLSPHPVAAEDLRRAARHLASVALDADDLRLLLDALGLRAGDGLADAGPTPAPPPEPLDALRRDAKALGAALLTDVGTAMSRGRR